MGSLSPSHNLQSSSLKESLSFSCLVTSRSNKYNHEVQPRYAATILYQLYGKPLPRSTRLWAGSRPSPNCFGLLSRIVSVFSRRICRLLTLILLSRCVAFAVIKFLFAALFVLMAAANAEKTGELRGSSVENVEEASQISVHRRLGLCDRYPWLCTVAQNGETTIASLFSNWGEE